MKTRTESPTDAMVQAFYRSKEWRRLRKHVRQRDHYECTICKSNGRVTRGSVTAQRVHRGSDNSFNSISSFSASRLHVHHIESVREAWSKRLDPHNCTCVCVSCHNKLHPEKLEQNHQALWDERW